MFFLYSLVHFDSPHLEITVAYSNYYETSVAVRSEVSYAARLQDGGGARVRKIDARAEERVQ